MWSHQPAGSLPFFWVTLDPDICIPPLKEAEGLSIKRVTHHQLTWTCKRIKAKPLEFDPETTATYCNMFKLMPRYAAFPLYAIALHSSAQGPWGLHGGMGNFAIAGHGMPDLPDLLLRRRSEDCLMPRWQGMSSSVSSAKNLRHTILVGMQFV